MRCDVWPFETIGENDSHLEEDEDFKCDLPIQTKNRWGQKDLSVMMFRDSSVGL